MIALLLELLLLLTQKTQKANDTQVIEIGANAFAIVMLHVRDIDEAQSTGIADRSNREASTGDIQDSGDNEENTTGLTDDLKR